MMRRFSFGGATDFPDSLSSNLRIVKTHEHALKDIVSGEAVRSVLTFSQSKTQEAGSQ